MKRSSKNLNNIMRFHGWWWEGTLFLSKQTRARWTRIDVCDHTTDGWMDRKDALREANGLERRGWRGVNVSCCLSCKGWLVDVGWGKNVRVEPKFPEGERVP